MKNKILIDGRMMNHAGIGVFIQNIVKRLSEKKEWDLTLFVPKKTENTPSILLEKVQTIAFDVPIYSPWEQIQYPIKISPCDLYWTPHFNAPLLPIRAKKRVVTIHDTFHLSHKERFSFSESLYSQILYRSAIRRADLVTTVSQFSKKEIENHFPSVKNNVEVVYNGVDSFLFCPTKNPGKYPLPPKYFLFVGSLKPHKNLLSLLLAFEIFLTYHPDFSLIIVGKKEGLLHGDNLDNFLSRKSLMGKVHLFHDVPTSDLPLFYSSAFAFIFPSLYEGFGLPLLEAMSCSCPVLASDVASIPEVCQDAASYFDPLDPQSIALSMKKLVISPSFRNRLIESGAKRCKDFSWDVAADALHILFQRLINEKNCSCS